LARVNWKTQKEILASNVYEFIGLAGSPFKEGKFAVNMLFLLHIGTFIFLNPP
jgi:hypothetical protein